MYTTSLYAKRLITIKDKRHPPPHLGRAANGLLTSAHLSAVSSAVSAGAAMSNLNLSAEVDALSPLEDWVSVTQHHDAITSSQRRHVHRDYVSKLSAGTGTTTSRILLVRRLSPIQIP